LDIWNEFIGCSRTSELDPKAKNWRSTRNTPTSVSGHSAALTGMTFIGGVEEATIPG
jgi:hypothetical protein